MASMNCVLGLDGGGTKTKGVVCDERGHVLGSGTAGPSNYQVVSKEQVKASLAEAAARAIEAAGIERENVSAVCLGMAGLDSQTDYDVIWCLLQEIDLPGEVHLVNDAVVALAGATAGRPGVVVNAGTGAIAFGVNERGESRRASGWGHILGDEGSGYDIGRRGIIASLRAHDGRGARDQPDVPLVSALRPGRGGGHHGPGVSAGDAPFPDRCLCPGGDARSPGRR
jgi:N-acetylglucosamine kinase-like BadF-type ATPase